MVRLAFKGDTYLRKLIFGSAGRFSEDLDFTLDTDRPEDDVLTELVEIVSSVEKRFAVLRQLTDLDQQVIADAKSGRNEALAERLRAEIRKLAAAK